MSQQVLAVSQDKILLASDSLVMAWEEVGAVARGCVRKLHQVGSRALACSVGLAVGVDLTRALAERVRLMRLESFGLLERFARSFLEGSFARFAARHRRWFEEHPEAPRLLYFTLAGYEERAKRCRAVVWESKDLEVPFEEISLGPVLTMPRVLTLEARLLSLWQDPGMALPELARFCLEALEKISARDERVGGPFQVAAVTPQGVEFFFDFQESA